MKRLTIFTLAVLVVAGTLAGPASAADGDKLSWTGVNYTKFLAGNRHYDGSMYNFTTIPGEGYGDNGQGTEFELLFSSRPSSKIEVNGRIKSRFNQNQWTNWGGFGGSPNDIGSVGGDGGEFDPRSNQYVKLRGITVNITPGYTWLNRATIGSSDFGMFDPFTIGKIRYIDRDNGKGLFFNGSFAGGQISYDVARMSLSRLWAGPNYSTGEYTSMDAAYGVQLRSRPLDYLGITGIFSYVNDIELDPRDDDADDGRDVRQRQRNQVFGLKMDYSNEFGDFADFTFNPAFYYSKYYTLNDFDGDGNLDSGGFGSYTTYPLGNLDDVTWLADFNLDNIADSGLSISGQYFDIGSDYVSVMAARRESDVLLTEGHEATWYYPEADNASWRGTSVLGYGGFLGHAQQVATTNVDNEFTDFDEPMAQTVIGWKGFTVVPSIGVGDLDLSAELSFIDYNTNWQMWGDDEMYTWGDSPYPTTEPDAGFGSFRNAYMPFQEKTTNIYVFKANYFLDLGDGVDVHARWKYIDEEDLRINEEEYIPFNEDGSVNNAETAGHYSAVDGAKLFTDLADDDKQMDMYLYEIGAGYQLTDELYLDLTYQYYDVELVDGNTAFMGNRSHRMAGGDHVKNNIIADASYMIGGAEFGMIYQWSFGEWAPNFGDDYTVVTNDDGDRGFINNWGGFESTEKREYYHSRMKAYMKLLF
ncbi:hypothetical protein GF314_00285 [bacterium]|nr:hypothetical protein [bacterium]